MKGRVLVVAGSDSSAGAGIQADIKTVAALGGYATTAITALTAQNTLGVHEIMAVSPSFIRRQMEVVLEDIGADCIKTGMLYDAAVIDVVVEVIRLRADGMLLVVDPVVAASDGTRLLDAAAVDALKRQLIPRATMLTPNLPEAEILTGMTLNDVGDMQSAAEALVTLGSRYVLVKGGHMSGAIARDVFVGDGQMTVIESPRIETRHTHGTGCTLASGIAVGLAQGMAPLSAVRRARSYLTEAIRSAPGFGSGHGPLNHTHAIFPPAK
jgi:hydroxymethylpyrimidine/phosphomethylpyrimidine kinase